MSAFFKFLSSYVCVLALFVFAAPIDAAYILRYTTTDNGGIIFTGNTLGLSKKLQENNPGTADSIGAFITTKMPLPLPVGQYVNDGTKAGTTLDYTQSSSSAVLDLPTGSTVLYAELIWSGSYDYFSQITGTEPDGPVTLIAPNSNTYQFAADALTKQNAITPQYACSDPQPTPTPCKCPCGNYVRSAMKTTANVALKDIINLAGAGTYTVGGVAGTIAAGDDTHNNAGWTLAVIYRNPNMFTYNMTLFVGCEQSSYNTNTPAAVTGFCAPSQGPLKGRLFLSAAEADASKTGDTMLFGSQLPLTSANSLSGVNNPTNNFFCSQINTRLPLSIDPFTGKLVATGSGQLDTRGSYGNANHNPVTGVDASPGRQGYDITSIDISNTLSYNQTTAYALGTTTGDDYTLNALAMQIQVGAPLIKATKKVNGQTNITSSLGNTVTFDMTLQNLGTATALSTVLQDPLASGLSYVSGSFFLNGVLQPDPNLVTGVNIGDIAVNQTVTIQFKAKLVSVPQSGSTYYNSAPINYSFQPCNTGSSVPLSTVTNIVSINICGNPPPGNCQGTIQSCHVTFTWTAPPSGGVTCYNFYNGCNNIHTHSCDSPLTHKMCHCLFKPRSDVYNLEMTCMYSDGSESPRTPIIVTP